MAACAACEVNIAAAGPKGDQPRGWSSRVERMRLASTDRLIAGMLLGEGFLLSPSGCSKQPTTRGYFLGLPPYSPPSYKEGRVLGYPNYVYSPDC
jgi:hypothetical protein